MTKRMQFTVTALTSADPTAVFDLLRAGKTWPTWSPITSFALLHPDDEGGEGVGAVRDFTIGFLHSHEQLTEITPGRRLRYSIVGGVPVREHRAVVDLRGNGAGTTILWREEFEATIPGTGAVVRHLMRHIIRRGASGLAGYAAELATTPGETQ